MSLRLALVGAFPFPLAQGSQRYLADQAHALGDAGARVTVVCYGRGDGRSTDGLDLVRAPRWATPRRLASGLSARKPIADLELTLALLRAHRRERFDAVLAHNAEAALAGFSARAAGGPPVIYVAHTLFENELSSHLPERAGPVKLSSSWERLGAVLDRRCARHADAVLVLTEAAQRALAPHTRGPLACVPPGRRAEPHPDVLEIDEICRRERLEPGGYVVYAGNLDRYQGLDVLDAAAAALPDVPCVAVTHAMGSGGFRALRPIRVASAKDARALVFGASLAVVPRRVAGGFPLKVLDAMEAGLAIVGHAASLGGLRHDESAWCLPADAEPDQWAAAVATLHSDPHLRARLGRGARAVLERDHAWPRLADQTLQLVASLR